MSGFDQAQGVPLDERDFRPVAPQAGRKIGGLEELDIEIANLHDVISGLTDELQEVLSPEPEPAQLAKLEDVASPFRSRAVRVRDATSRLNSLRRGLDL